MKRDVRLHSFDAQRQFYRLALALAIFVCLAPPVAAQTNHTPYAFTTFAGSAGNAGLTNGAGVAAHFNSPSGIALDAAGNVYIADDRNHTIRLIGPEGTVSTFAGTGTHGIEDGLVSTARFERPKGVAVDEVGNVYVADTDNHTIRKIAGGMVSTLAGRPRTPGIQDGLGTNARFNFPFGIATDKQGNVYVADRANSTIRKVTPGGMVSTVAGTAGVTNSLDGVGTNASFHFPHHMVFDSAGNMFVADHLNHTIRKITPEGVVSTAAGEPRDPGLRDGVGREARFFGPIGLAMDGEDNLYIVERSNHAIRRMSPDGVVSRLTLQAGSAGSEDGGWSWARFTSPSGIAIDGAGNLWVADTGNNTVRVGWPPEVNGTFATRTRLEGLYARALGWAAGAIIEHGEPFGPVEALGSIWWSWTAPADGAAIIRVVTPTFECNTDNSFSVGVYTGATPPLTEVIATNFYGFALELRFDAVAGVEYAIRVVSGVERIAMLTVQLCPDCYRLAVQTLPLGGGIVGRDPAPYEDENHPVGTQVTFTAEPVAGMRFQGWVGDILDPSNPITILNDRSRNVFALFSPINDRFADAITLEGSYVSVNAYTYGATAGEPGEPTLPGDASVWYQWTAPASGRFYVFGAAAVFTGTDLPNLSPVEIEDGSFEALVGVTYQVAVFGWSDTPLVQSVALSLSPPNDAFADALEIPYSSNAISVSGSHVGATREDGEPDHGIYGDVEVSVERGNRSIWWYYSPPESGQVTVRATRNRDWQAWQTIMAVYEGGSIANLQLVTHNFRSSQPPWASYPLNLDAIDFDVVSQQRYSIAIDEYSRSDFEDPSSSPTEFTLSFHPRPANNDFIDRTEISGPSVDVFGTNAGADSEPAQADMIGSRSVWWTWTPTESGRVMISTVGSGFDTVLAVYTGSTLESLMPVDVNDDTPVPGAEVSEFFTYDMVSRIVFDAVDGMPYQIAVAGNSESSAEGVERARYGAIRLGVKKLAIEATQLARRIVRGDRAVDFRSTVRVSNWRSTATRPLRLRLVATPSGHLQGVEARSVSLDADSEAGVRDEDLGVFYLQAPETIDPQASVDVSVSGRCPPPTHGWSVVCILEEQTPGEPLGHLWHVRDSRVLLFGEEPCFESISGGVVAVASSLGSAPGDIGFVDVVLGPPAAIRSGASWRVSPTLTGSSINYRNHTNWLHAGDRLPVDQESFSIEFSAPEGFVAPVNRTIEVTKDAIVTLDLRYLVAPPRLVFDRSLGVGLNGTRFTTYQLQYTSGLAPLRSWTHERTVTLGPGLNWTPNTGPQTIGSRVYRAVWLED